LLGDELVLLEPSKQKSLGGWLVAIVVLPVFLISTFFTLLCYDMAPWFGVLFEALATYFCLEFKKLCTDSQMIMNDYYGDGADAMKHTAFLVTGRELKGESEGELSANAITYIANEASDSVLSPLFVMFLFGPVGGFIYRTIDIIDSEVGYQNHRYEFFGSIPAKINRVVDYLPGRFAGALTVFAARHTFGGFDGRNARFIHLRDKCKAISAFAGALNIALKDKTVGDMDKEPQAKDIRVATRLLRNDYLLVQAILVILLLIF
jgi:adenosylcobinamide-phosphate synthase